MGPNYPTLPSGGGEGGGSAYGSGDVPYNRMDTSSPESWYDLEIIPPTDPRGIIADVRMNGVAAAFRRSTNFVGAVVNELLNLQRWLETVLFIIGGKVDNTPLNIIDLVNHILVAYRSASAKEGPADSKRRPGPAQGFDMDQLRRNMMKQINEGLRFLSELLRYLDAHPGWVPIYLLQTNPPWTPEEFRRYIERAIMKLEELRESIW